MSRRLEAVAGARLLVAALGEAASPPWWRSQAMTEVSGRWLERLFPRTALGAALEVAGRAARLEHDARIGRTGAYHLFRLPPAVEADLQERMRNGSLDLTSWAALRTREERLRALGELAGAEPIVPVAGPVNCGSVDGLSRGRALQRLCAAYAGAFAAGAPAYPYLEASATP
jgi:hypothetical protein